MSVARSWWVKTDIKVLLEKKSCCSLQKQGSLCLFIHFWGQNQVHSEFSSLTWWEVRVLHTSLETMFVQKKGNMRMEAVCNASRSKSALATTWVVSSHKAGLSRVQRDHHGMTPKGVWWAHKLVSEAWEEGLKDLAKGLCGCTMSCVWRETQVPPGNQSASPREWIHNAA